MNKSVTKKVVLLLLKTQLCMILSSDVSSSPIVLNLSICLAGSRVRTRNIITAKNSVLRIKYLPFKNRISITATKAICPPREEEPITEMAAVPGNNTNKIHQRKELTM